MNKKLAYFNQCRRYIRENIGWYQWWKKTYCFIWLLCHGEWQGTRQKYKRMKKECRRRFA